MPAPPRPATMTHAQLVTAREFLGITGDWIAAAAHVNRRTHRRWEAGDTLIPAEVQTLIETLHQLTADAVAHLTERLPFLTDRGLILLRTDADYQAAAPAGTAMPARWHHHVAARAAERAPAAMIAFQGEHAPPGNWLRQIVALTDPHTISLHNVNYTTTRLPHPADVHPRPGRR
jgi:hypothetical protein